MTCREKYPIKKLNVKVKIKNKVVGLKTHNFFIKKIAVFTHVIFFNSC